MDEARSHGERVVASIFVNPTQFCEGEDFLGYPKTLEKDTRQLCSRGVDLLFAPSRSEVYPQRFLTTVTVPELSDLLCGEYRPGHFSAVATVVLKLFNIVQPEVSVFGEKDFQQLMIIRKMVTDLNSPVQIRSVATVREPDGLALSSRNCYLTESERCCAPGLYRALCHTVDSISKGCPDFGTLENQQKKNLRAMGFRPDYFSVRRRSDLEPPHAGDTELVVLAAAWLGSARLIDNKTVSTA
jgi:pantoate--beta-alanine ligase